MFQSYKQSGVLRFPRGGETMSERFKGDIAARDAWALLERDPTATLVDVRTRAEWTYVGLPDLRPVGRSAVLLEWQSYPDMQVNPAFLTGLKAELDRRGLGPSAPVLFLCRSGVRSLAAARAAAAEGYSETWNIAGGFEGPLDPEGHRGRVDGWKANSLPWVQN